MKQNPRFSAVFLAAYPERESSAGINFESVDGINGDAAELNFSRRCDLESRKISRRPSSPLPPPPPPPGHELDPIFGHPSIALARAVRLERLTPSFNPPAVCVPLRPGQGTAFIFLGHEVIGAQRRDLHR